MCLPSDALSQLLPSYLGFSYLGRGLSLHGCSSKAQPLLLTLGDGYLLIATPPDLERGVAPLGPSTPAQPPPLGRGVAPPGRRPGLGHGVSLLAYQQYIVTDILLNAIREKICSSILDFSVNFLMFSLAMKTFTWNSF